MAASRLGRRGDERLDREVRVRLAAGEVAGQLPDDAAVARGEPERRVAVQGQRAVGGERPRGVSIAPPLSSRSRVSCLASSTLGWSNGSMPSTIPATAVANSQRQASAPRSIGSLKRDADDRVAGGLEGCGELVASAVVRAGQVEADEDAVRAVVGDVAERLEVDRDDPDAALAGALGDQLLQPRPEAADLVVGQECQLVAPVGGQRADGDAERERPGSSRGPAGGRRRAS